MSEHAALAARGVTMSRSGRRVVDDVGLDLRSGHVTALLGPNGAGKSTLLAGLTGLLAVDGGSVKANGRIASALQAPALARRTVRANIELALTWWGTPRSARRNATDRALERLGALELAERRADALSGGEARRAHIARALAVEAEILVLDEPFAGLDPQARGDLLHDLGGALREGGAATLVVVHDRGDALAIADEMLVMIGGRIVARGAPADLIERPPSMAVAEFLGYDGRLQRGGRLLLTRPAHLAIDPSGELEGVVVRSTPVEDGSRLRVQTDQGEVSAGAPLIAPAVGERVRLRLSGGASFPNSR